MSRNRMAVLLALAVALGTAAPGAPAASGGPEAPSTSGGVAAPSDPLAPSDPVAVRVQSHSMIHTCCTSAADRESLMAAAEASGAGIVRLDVEVHGIVLPARDGYRYDFSKLDEVIELGRLHGIRILGILSGTPSGMEDCAPGTRPELSWRCAPADPDEYARHVVAIMEHAGDGVLAWEFWNEPDERYMYTGTPEAYGRTLGVIHALAAGRFRITTGGIADLSGGLPFLRRAIAAGARFDIGNVHLRGTDLEEQTRQAARFFEGLPLWVTEHGYPSDPAPDEQLQNLRTSLPELKEGGADQVFVTLRDIDEFGSDSPFASEGILGKPAWRLVVETNRLVTEIRMHRRLRSYDNYFMKLSSGLKLHSP